MKSKKTMYFYRIWKKYKIGGFYVYREFERLKLAKDFIKKKKIKNYILERIKWEYID